MTKTQQKVILAILNDYWECYLNGDWETAVSHLDDEVRIIGSTEAEIYKNKAEAIEFFKASQAEIAGKLQVRNKQSELMAVGDLVLSEEHLDLFIDTGGMWNFYSRIRVSSLLRNTGGGWKIIHQHGSVPDNKVTEGETVGFEQVSKENQELRDAIKRRTAELEYKNRELEIEAALERIRAQVTGMQESADLLDIVVTMRSEFLRLGHEAHYFWHMRWLPETYQKAMTSGDGTRIGMVMELPRHIHGDIPLLATWEKGDELTVVYPMDTEEALDYVDKMVSLGDFQQIDPQAPSADDIRHIGGLTFVMARTTHGEIGFSLPGKVLEPPVQALETLVRFASVFDLAYRRFEDLRESEGQKREAEIELGLERVRAKAMAMQKSDELADVAFVLFNQLRGLGGDLWGTGFGLCEKDMDSDRFWFAYEKGVLPPAAIPNTTDPAHKKMYEGWMKGMDFMALEASGKELEEHYRYMLSLPDIRPFFQEILDKGFEFPKSQQWNAAYFRHGYLLIITVEPYPEPEILKRFARVFDQTYTRFLDLQKAEELAREGQIELGLERVRAKAMAMQHSNELSQLVGTLFQELTRLDFTLTFCIINIIDEADRSNTVWAANPNTGKDPESYYMKFEDYPFHHGMWAAWKAQRSHWVYIIEGQEKELYDEYLYKETEFRRFPEEVKEANKALERYVAGFTFSNFGGLQTVSEDPISEANLDILARFGKVFDQTYTRFLDLQKAEAQAREAQIEAALEKVRSRTMAMQQSDELPEAANVLFLEIQALGIPAWSCGYNILAEDKKSAICWMSSEGTLQKPFTLRLWGEASFEEMGAFIQSDKTMLVQELGGKALEEHYAYMLTFPDLQPIFEDLKKEGLELPTYQINHLCKFSHGFVLFITYELVPEAQEIFERFTTVFDQTYTRFLDLKKAEAQTRQSKIETAMERVRARALAMQEPEELKQVAEVLRREMGLLGVEELETSSIYINDEVAQKAECWYAIKDIREEEKVLVSDHFDLDLNETWVGREMMNFYESAEDQVSIVMKGDARKEWIAYCEKHSQALKGYYERTSQTAPTISTGFPMEP